MIYTPEQTAAILSAINAIVLGNNGHANIGTDETVAEAVRAAGFVVVIGSDLHGNRVNRGFTQRGWDAHVEDAIAANRARVAARKAAWAAEGPDYEGAILARNDRHLFA